MSRITIYLSGGTHLQRGPHRVRARARSSGVTPVRQPLIGHQSPGVSTTLAGLGNRAGAPGGTSQPKTRRRSTNYVAAVRKLDAGTAEHADVAAIVDEVLAEFGAGAGLPLGLVARCYLGVPFEVHSLDLAGGVVQHYKQGEPLPHPLDRARRLASHNSYVAIEVYPDRLVCLLEDGRAVEIQG